MNNKILGKQGEDVAAEYLARKGYRIIARNYRVPRGEIDIVAQTSDTIVFVEVKTRRSECYGRPAAAVDYRKQAKIIGVAQWFLRQRRLEGWLCRFDVIEVYAGPGEWRVRHLPAAFEK